MSLSEKVNYTKIINETGSRFRKFRIESEFNQGDIEKLLGLKPGIINHIEKGDIFPPPELLKALQQKFNLSLDWLITGSGKMYYRDWRDKESSPLYEEHIKILGWYVENVPFVQSAVLGFFYQFLFQNRKMIDKYLTNEGITKIEKVRH